MNQQEYEATRKLVQLAVATQMARAGITSTTFSRADMEAIEDSYDVQTAYDVDRGWTITVRPLHQPTGT